MVTRAHALSYTFPPLLRLRGLDAARTYTVAETGESYTGAELMQLGVAIPLPGGDAASVSWVLRAQ